MRCTSIKKITGDIEQDSKYKERKEGSSKSHRKNEYSSAHVSWLLPDPNRRLYHSSPVNPFGDGTKHAVRITITPSNRTTWTEMVIWLKIYIGFGMGRAQVKGVAWAKGMLSI